MSTEPIKLIALPPPIYSFLMEVMGRATQGGLFVPDELPYAAALWDRIKNAQTVATSAPPQDSSGIASQDHASES